MYNTYRYFFSVMFVCCAFSIVNGQESGKLQNDSTKKFVLNSVRIELDVSPVLTTFLNRGEIFQYEAAVQTEINKRFYPVFELGFAGANREATSGITFQGDALFYRIGMDFNLIKSKNAHNRFNNFFLVGARLGYSYLNYDLLNIDVSDNYRGIIQHKDVQQSSSHIWFEITAGIRVEIFKNIYTGWTVRTKNLLSQSLPGSFKPWYIPGYGINGDESVWGFNYLIGYKF